MQELDFEGLYSPEQFHFIRTEESIGNGDRMDMKCNVGSSDQLSSIPSPGSFSSGIACSPNRSVDDSIMSVDGSMDSIITHPTLSSFTISTGEDNVGILNGNAHALSDNRHNEGQENSIKNPNTADALLAGGTIHHGLQKNKNPLDTNGEGEEKGVVFPSPRDDTSKGKRQNSTESKTKIGKIRRQDTFISPTRQSFSGYKRVDGKVGNSGLHEVGKVDYSRLPHSAVGRICHLREEREKEDNKSMYNTHDHGGLVFPKLGKYVDATPEGYVRRRVFRRRLFLFLLRGGLKQQSVQTVFVRLPKEEVRPTRPLTIGEAGKESLNDSLDHAGWIQHVKERHSISLQKRENLRLCGAAYFDSLRRSVKLQNLILAAHCGFQTYLLITHDKNCRPTAQCVLFSHLKELLARFNQANKSSVVDMGMGFEAWLSVCAVVGPGHAADLLAEEKIVELTVDCAYTCGPCISSLRWELVEHSRTIENALDAIRARQLRHPGERIAGTLFVKEFIMNRVGDIDGLEVNLSVFSFALTNDPELYYAARDAKGTPLQTFLHNALGGWGMTVHVTCVPEEEVADRFMRNAALLGGILNCPVTIDNPRGICMQLKREMKREKSRNKVRMDPEEREKYHDILEDVMQLFKNPRGSPVFSRRMNMNYPNISTVETIELSTSVYQERENQAETLTQVKSKKGMCEMPSPELLGRYLVPASPNFSPKPILAKPKAEMGSHNPIKGKKSKRNSFSISPE